MCHHEKNNSIPAKPTGMISVASDDQKVKGIESSFTYL